jgi:hypothetical protein
MALTSENAAWGLPSGHAWGTAQKPRAASSGAAVTIYNAVGRHPADDTPPAPAAQWNGSSSTALKVTSG